MFIKSQKTDEGACSRISKEMSEKLYLKGSEHLPENFPELNKISFLRFTSEMSNSKKQKL